MENILDLNYVRLLCGFCPTIDEGAAKTLSQFNQQVGLELTKKDNLYRYSIRIPDHMYVNIMYKISGDISNLVDETTLLLENTAQKSGLKDKDYFTLKSSRILPFDLYEAEVHKQIVASLFKQFGLGH